MSGQTGKSLEGKELFNGSAKTDASNAYKKAIQQKTKTGGYRGRPRTTQNDYIAGLVEGYDDLDIEDIPEIINRTEKNIKSLTEAEKELNAIPESQRDKQ